MAVHSTIPARRMPGRGAWQATVLVSQSRTGLSDFHFLYQCKTAVIVSTSKSLSKQSEEEGGMKTKITNCMRRNTFLQGTLMGKFFLLIDSVVKAKRDQCPRWVLSESICICHTPLWKTRGKRKNQKKLCLDDIVDTLNKIPQDRSSRLCFV